LNITCYYQSINQGEGKYYGVRFDAIDSIGDSLIKKTFITSKLMPGADMENDYIVAIPDEIKSSIYDIQIQLQDVDMANVLEEINQSGGL
jgi:hypothetical protein